ncbi:hypothetical protein I204_02980 [Kwoniella mangroviensis CBS 8886]|nr:uncharacterized protein I203_00040 [Kwoniella mangroviensis CBS 8507]OCF69913.1 hypothetical protein I203_00040 [Kwoniella mangroviensis CBS 8507]OCF75688.1 hypothetical protein I204_02980 [Kwoniella mangroviensis CBS 8886]
MPYSDTPTKQTQRLFLQPDGSKALRRTESIRKYVMSPSPISKSSIDTSPEFSSTFMSRSGTEIRWKDRTIYRIGRNVTAGYPIDLIEQERQEAEHHLLRILLGYPYHGPVLDILKSSSRMNRKRILDMGTGTGIWATDMADLFPHVDVIGTDEVDIQPELVPPNCEFYISDLTKPLPYPLSSFDIIHIRFLSTRVQSYPSILSQALTLLRPNGLLLLFENFTFSPPQTVHDITPKGVQAFYDCYKRSFSSSGLKVCKLEDVVGTLRGGGDIKGDLIKVPIGHGTGRMTQLSKIHLINLKAWIESTRYTIIEGGGYTNNEFDILSQAFIDDLEKEELYTCYHSLWVKKPTNVSQNSE